MGSMYSEMVLSRINSAKHRPGIPIKYSDKLHRYINAIHQSTSYVVGGRESGGKRSFTDMFFFISAYMSWCSMPAETRPPLKIIYFNMDKPLHIKMQKWLCVFLSLFYDEFIDINTLNGSNGRLYDLNPDIMEKIRQAQGFFDYMFDSGILKVIDGPKHPTGIYVQTVETLRECGYLEKEKYKRSEFIYNEGLENQITLVIIDNVEKLNGESKNGESISNYQLHEIMVGYLEDLKSIYKVTPVTIVPSFRVPGLSMKKDMVPDFREFQNYYRQADVAINLFNPSAYLGNGTEWYGYNIPDFVTPPDNVNRFRTAHIIRNTMGVDNITIPYVFYPENGRMMDAPYPNSADYPDYISRLNNYKTNFINDKNSSK